MTDFDAESYLAQLTTRPGVYQMFDDSGELLYVGKAKNLKNRVTSYFRASGLSAKTMALVARIANIEVTVTTTERDALLLEHNLIKQYRPPYNILLKDDKSYPYIYLSSEDRWPRLSFHRGTKRRKGEYFGPYPSAGAVRSTLHLMQKVFKVRQCRDSYFRNRSRPCLQYQIGRCSGPCVGLVSDEEYQEQLDKTVLFLNGRSQDLLTRLADDMESAAAELEYEKAADIRDQISQLQNVQATQNIEGTRGDLDLMAVFTEHGHACVQVLFVREARVLGSRSYYPQIRLDEAPEAILEAFLPQFYLSGQQQIPQEIVTSHAMADGALLEEALGAESGRKVVIKDKVRDARSRWLQMAEQNAQNNLRSSLRASRRWQADWSRCVARLILRRYPPAWSVLISATVREKPRWPPAWYLTATARESLTTANSISKTSPRVTTTPPCSRHWSDATSDSPTVKGSCRIFCLSTAEKGR
jgi:excinuclease ABC subunit C